MAKSFVVNAFADEDSTSQLLIKRLRAPAKGQLARLDTQTQEFANQYRAVMQKPFDAWNLTASEQDVVIGMLKGLSFRKIAGLRETREKTVR